MNISEIFSRAADYTKSLLSHVGVLIILFVVSIIPIINFIAIGYYGRVIKDRSDSQVLPPLRGFWELFVDGLKAFIAGLIWSIPIILLFITTFVPIFLTMRWDQMITYAGSPALLLRAAAGILKILMFIVAFLIAIVAVMGIVHMFKTGSFGKAFAVGELMTIIGKIGFARYLFWLIVAAILGTVVSGFTMIPIVGWVISDLLGIILMVFLARSISLMYDSVFAAAAPVPTPTPISPPPPQTPVQPPPPPSPP